MRDGTRRRRSVPCPPSCRYGCTRRRHRAKRASARIARAPGSMRVKARLQRLPGLSVSTRGHQLQLEVDPAVADVSAHGLADALLAEDPAVVLWSQLAREARCCSPCARQAMRWRTTPASELRECSNQAEERKGCRRTSAMRSPTSSSSGRCRREQHAAQRGFASDTMSSACDPNAIVHSQASRL